MVRATSHETPETFSILGQFGALGTNPFYQVRFVRSQVDQLVSMFRACANDLSVRHTLAVTHEAPNRMRLRRNEQPEYERHAAALHLRGDIFRVQGKDRSCNIEFGALAAREMADRLELARDRMKTFMVWRVPSRRFSLLDIIPDVDLVSPTDADNLASSSSSAAASTWTPESFADWERDS